MNAVTEAAAVVVFKLDRVVVRFFFSSSSSDLPTKQSVSETQET